MLLADRILFIDAEAIVLDKPAGLPVDMPKDGVLAVENHLDTLRLGFMRRPGIVHRLDRDTSGCLLLARNPKAQKRFGAAFEAGAVEKLYLAVVEGEPAREGVIDLPLAKVSTREAGWRMVGDPKRGKAARTAWRVIATTGGRSLVAFTPATGRTHQLRVHAASGMGTPIVGDPVYGDGRGRMLLHAAKLRVLRDGKAAIVATAPLPETFGAFREHWAPDADG